MASCYEISDFHQENQVSPEKVNVKLVPHVYSRGNCQQLHDRLERRRGFTVCKLYILKLQYKVHACV